MDWATLVRFAFDLFDVDKSGRLEIEEVEKLVCYVAGTKKPDARAKKVLKMMDDDGDGEGERGPSEAGARGGGASARGGGASARGGGASARGGGASKASAREASERGGGLRPRERRLLAPPASDGCWRPALAYFVGARVFCRCRSLALLCH
jgi:hypothetical protein